MMKETLFRDNIVSNILNNFMFYLSYDELVYYMLAVVLLGFINVAVVRKFFSKEQYCFINLNKKDDEYKKGYCGYVLLFLSFILYVINILSLENSIFNAYDSMSFNNINNMLYGVLPTIKFGRFNPIAGVDHNIIYAMSHNYNMINCWIIIKQAICLFLLYKVFYFIPVDKRLMFLAVINILPSVFWVNNIIFPEQIALIFILLSLLCLIKCNLSNRFSHLLWFVLFMNFAIYTKETVILFYAGVLIFLVFRRIFNEEIVLKSFLHPLKTIKMMPIEYLMFCNMLIYSIFYLLSSDLFTSGTYISHNHKDLFELLKINSLELFINLTSLILLFFNIHKTGNWLGKGIVIGCSLMTIVIIFYFQIGGYPDFYKTWYLYLPTIFCTGYIFNNLNKKWLLIIFIPIVLFSFYKNWWIFEKEEGKSRRELVEYMISQGNQPTFYFVDKENFHDGWMFESFNSALKYTFPNGNIIFETNHDFHPRINNKNDYFYKTIKSDLPVNSDFIIVYKYKSYNISVNATLVYENKFYKVYKLNNEDKK